MTTTSIPTMSSSSTISTIVSVEEAVNHSITLIQAYSERDPYDKDPQNPWNNPRTMLDSLEQARDQVMAAWRNLEQEQPHAMNHNSTSAATTTLQQQQQQEEPDVRALYMDMITDAFADVLEDMRQSSTDPVDVDILVDCLQSGLDLLTAEERGLLCSMQDDDDDEDNDAVMEEDDFHLDDATANDSNKLVTCQ